MSKKAYGIQIYQRYEIFVYQRAILDGDYGKRNSSAVDADFVEQG
jgi:hypothetical protein